MKMALFQLVKHSLITPKRVKMSSRRIRWMLMNKEQLNHLINFDFNLLINFNTISFSYIKS